MLPKELYSKIQKFHFKTRFLANDLFAGQYVSAFKGKGMEFAEVREYTEGDDVRDIDWNVTARFGRPFVKVFTEERELTVVLVVDLSASNLFGTRGRFKRDLVAEIAGVLSFAAIRTNDKVGALLFSSEVERFIPPKKGAGHVWGTIREVFAHKPRSGATDLGAPLAFLSKVLRRHAIVFYISDFLAPAYDRDFRVALSLTARKHDLTAVRVFDPAERRLPPVGLAWLADPETGRTIAVDTADRKTRARWGALVEKRDRDLKKILAASRVPLVEIATNGSVIEPLAAYFRMREARR